MTAGTRGGYTRAQGKKERNDNEVAEMAAVPSGVPGGGARAEEARGAAELLAAGRCGWRGDVAGDEELVCKLQVVYIRIRKRNSPLLATRARTTARFGRSHQIRPDPVATHANGNIPTYTLNGPSLGLQATGEVDGREWAEQPAHES